ncbi:MAG: hypothetical protein QOK40_3163 [Miltoncostaeaceae bacterium]|nr:hypothetical protein [Miltoncostaeaceae bacterium]
MSPNRAVDDGSAPGPDPRLDLDWEFWRPPPDSPAPTSRPPRTGLERGGRGQRPSRDELARRLGRLKRGALAIGIAGFGTLSWLAAGHRTGVSSHPPPTRPAAPAAPTRSSGGFFDQDGSSRFVDPAPVASAPAPVPVASSGPS